MNKLRCPKCNHPVHTRLHLLKKAQATEPDFYITFSCPESYLTDRGRRRCGRPVVMTYREGKVIACFPVKWIDILGMALEDILKTYENYEIEE